MKKQFRISRLQTSTGFSITEVLVAVGVLTMVSLGMIESLSRMHGQLRGISQKQEIVELKNLMTQQLAKPGVCTWQLKDQVIDVSMATTDVSPSPSTLNLSELHMGPDATSPLLVKTGLAIPDSQSSLKVASILFKNIYATGNPNEYRGIFQINFDPSSLAMPVKPLQIQQVFVTDSTDPASAKRIQMCKGGTGNIKVECMTASKQGKVAGMKWQHDNFSTPTNLSEVFDVFEYPGGESAWGLACKPDYVQTTCSGSELASDTTMGPDVWQVQYGRLGCFSDNEELNGLDPTVYLTCCRFLTDS
jgi:hypothetical protein